MSTKVSDRPVDPTKDEKSSTTGTNNEVDVEKAVAAAEVASKPAAPQGLPEVPDGGLHAWLTIAGG